MLIISSMIRTYRNVFFIITCVLSSIATCCQKIDSCNNHYKNPVEGSPYFASHLFIDKIFARSNAIIPCQSLKDIEVAARLGFPSIELNVHETADRRFITIHGVKGCFGDQVTRRDGTSVATVPISSVDYEFICNNLIYRSTLPEYQTTIPTIEEALRACEINGICPYISGSYNEELFDIVARFHVTPIWGCYSSRDAIKTRKKTNGLITCWSSLKNQEEIVALCREVGPPYIHYIASEILNDSNRLLWSDDELSGLIRSVHNAGAYLGFAACYTPASLAIKLWELGFDYASSGWAVSSSPRPPRCSRRCRTPRTGRPA